MALLQKLKINIQEPNIRVIYKDAESSQMGITIDSVPTELTNIVGNSMRVALLGMTPGLKPTHVFVLGSEHELSNMSNINENMRNILANIVKTRIRALESFEKFDNSVEFHFKGSCNGELKFGDFTSNNKDFAIINPDQFILSTNGETDIEVSIIFTLGIGYIEGVNMEHIPGYITIDTFFSPIKNVIYKVDDISSSEGSNSVTIEVETDKSIKVEEALDYNFKLLSSYFSKMSIPDQVVYNSVYKTYDGNQYIDKEYSDKNMPVEELTLEVEEYNKLKELGIGNIREFINKRQAIPQELINKVKDELEEIGIRVIEKE